MFSQLASTSYLPSFVFSQHFLPWNEQSIKLTVLSNNFILFPSVKDEDWFIYYLFIYIYRLIYCEFSEVNLTFIYCSFLFSNKKWQNLRDNYDGSLSFTSEYGLQQIRGHFKNVFKICSCTTESKKVVAGVFSICAATIITHKSMRWSWLIFAKMENPCCHKIVQ